MTEEKHSWILIWWFVAFIFGLVVGCYTEKNGMEAMAIKHHAAHYDSQIGDFKWDDEGESK